MLVYWEPFLWEELKHIKMNRIIQILIPLLIINSSVTSKVIDTVNIQLKWIHQFQFAGFYMAKEKGFYAASGLEVQIKEGKPGLDIVKEVVNGTSQFGIGMPNLLIRKSHGEPIKLLYPIYQHSPLIILSKLESNIKTPKDLVGKKLMLNTSRDAQIEVMLKEMEVDYSMINVLPHTWNMDDLINDKVDAMTSYSTSQPFVMEEQGINYSLMDPKNYGVDFFGDCLFSSESFVKNNKRITDAFISSSMEGWKYALENIDETIDVIMNKYNTKLSKEFLKFEAHSSKKLIDISNINDRGHHENRWRYIKNVYQSKGLLKNDVNIRTFIYDMEKDFGKERLKRRFFYAIILLILIFIILVVILVFNWKLRKEINRSFEAEKKKNDLVLRQKELDELLYRTIVSINKMNQLSTVEIMDYALENAVKLTDSKIGYIYFYSEETEMLTLFAWSRNVMPECKVMNPQTDYELSKTGLWGEAIRQRKPIITNDYDAPNKYKKGTPEGHVPLKSHVNVPIFFEGEIVALIGVGNKTENYTDTDIRHLSILMDGVWMVKSQREMQQKVKESEALYKTLFDNAAEGVTLVNIEKVRMEYVNDAFKNMLGYNEDELKEIDIFKLNPESDKVFVKKIFNDAINNKSSSYFQNVPFISKDGTDFYFDIRTQKITISEKEYLLGLFANITERKSAEEEVKKINSELEARIEDRTKELKETLARLAESEKIHRVMFETMTQGVVYQNADGYVTRVNDAAVRMLGVDLDQFQGRTSMDSRWKTIHEDGSDFPGNEHPAMIALQTGKVVKDVIIGVYNPIVEDHIWINVTAVPLFRNTDEKPYQVYATLEDITEKRKVGLELKEAKENAEKANRAKSEFLANMSHEIRTPLNAVTGFSELLTGLIKDEKQQNYVNSIKIAGKSLLTLINDILDLSKIEAGMMEISSEPVNIKSLLNEIYYIFYAKAKEVSIEFTINVSDDMPDFLLLDETRVRQVLLNLVGNAFKFTQEGYVKINAKVDMLFDNKKVDLTIEIDDSGIGINENEQEDIFESFRQQEGQSSRKFGGTGLGLSICRKLVEMMNGSIHVSSMLGKGSKFSVELKNITIVNDQIPQTKDEEKFNYQSIVFDNPTILIVDDIESNRRLICELLNKHNCTVVEAENGEEAIQIAKYNKPDAIIMDIRMPIMDGKTAAKIIKKEKKLKDIPIIALTASITNHEVENIKEMGFKGYLSKPVNVNELFKELQDILKNKIVESKLNVLKDINNFPKVTNETNSSLVNCLKNEIIPEFDKMLKVMKMSQLKEYSNYLKTLYQKYDYQPLLIIAEKLASSIDAFDVLSIKKLKSDFDLIIEKLNSQKSDDYA